MRTKALLLIAAFAAAGVASSVAQVYSVNAVGYVNTTLVPNGFTLISNPLDAGAGNNTVGKLLSNIQGAIPTGLKAFTFDGATGSFRLPASYVNAAVGFSPVARANDVVNPGEGMFVFNPSASALTVTFVGQVMQGNLVNPLPQGFSVKANQVPQAGKPDSFGLQGATGDKIFKFDKTTGAYKQPSSYVNAAVGWSPATSVIEVGEAFFFFRNGAPGSWNRSFSVNNPS